MADEPMVERPVAGGGLTRRDTLKRIGMAGGIAWAAPVLSTINSPAFAQNGSPAPIEACDESNSDIDCGDPDSLTQCGSSGPFEFCFCTRDAAGMPTCVEDQFCEDLDPCGAGDVCPAGFVCVPDANNCCGEDKCVPQCSTQLANLSAVGLRLSGITVTIPIPIPDLP